MRIPPSMMVMGVVVAVPFGMGIRDTIKGNDRVSELDREQQRMIDESNAAAAAAREENERLAQAERAKETERETAFASLIGTQKAALGDRFGAQVGEVAPDSLEATLGEVPGLEGRDYEQPGLQLTGDRVIASVSFTIGEDHCDKMKALVRAAWGPAEDDIWRDPEHHRRASIDGLLCTLRFDRFVGDADYAKQVLAPLLGKSPEQAQKLLGTATSGISENSQIAWYLPGVMNGRSSTELIADIGEAGKITGYTASALMLPEQAFAIASTLETQLHETPEHESVTWYFPKHHVSAQYENHRFSISVTQ